MGAVTYPDPDVIDLLAERFVAFQTNAHAAAGSEDARLVARFRLLWEPGFVVLDRRGTELQRTVGFRPPAELVAWLELGLGKVALLEGRNDEAVDWFRRVAEAQPEPEVAPEAAFWSGIAAYRIEHDLGGLRRRWDEIRGRWPTSGWWTRADVFESDSIDIEREERT